ncbi:class I SAM-dependent methyltransferase [Ruminococcaceae bacterium OttesenSCG-928-L11]|nr:class I SAM-dependent methyltransferase [Ruminococcaceae bacterium OttesenSCG-928-L11]
MTDTKAFFNGAAKLWANKKPRRIDEENVRTVLRLSDIKFGWTILDAGCGAGFLEPYLLRYRPEQIWAVDFAENMIAAAKERVTDPRVSFSCVDVAEMAFNEESVDFCIFYNAFQHFSDQEQLVAHIASLLKPGGRLTISHPQSRRSGEGEDSLFSMLPAQGLINLLRPHFRLDVIIDNNVLFMVSGSKLKPVDTPNI